MTGWNSWDELTQELPRLPPAFFDDPVFRPGGPPPVQDVGPAVEEAPPNGQPIPNGSGAPVPNGQPIPGGPPIPDGRPGPPDSGRHPGQHGQPGPGQHGQSGPGQPARNGRPDPGRLTDAEARAAAQQAYLNPPRQAPPGARPGPIPGHWPGAADETVIIPPGSIDETVVIPPITGVGPAPGAPPAGPVPRAGRPAPAQSLGRASRTMAIASAASRLTGFLRSLAITAALGVALVGNAYNTANTLPNIVYELLLGGVLTSVVVPLLVQAQERDRDGGEAYTQRLLTLAVVGLGITTLVATLAAPLLTVLYSSDGGAKADLTTFFAYLLLPEIFFYGLGAMIGAILNTRGVFGPAAWSPVLNNIVVIAVAALFLVITRGDGSRTTTSLGTGEVLLLGIGTTFGIVVQALVLLPALRRTGFRFRPRLDLRGSRLGEAGPLALWVIGYVVVSQIGYLVQLRLANGIPDDQPGVTTFTNASLLFQMPYGILGVSLLTALMPRMSRAAARGDQDSVLSDLSLGSRLSALALLPVTALFVVLGPAIGTVIYGHGRTDVGEARQIGVVLAFSAFGLVPFAITMLQLRVFYAVKDARTPTVVNLVMMAARVLLSLLAAVTLSDRHLVAGLAVATSLSYVVGAVAGEALLRRRFGPLDTARTVRASTRFLVMSVLAGLAAWVVLMLVTGSAGRGTLGSLIGVLLGSVAAGAVLVVSVLVGRSAELDDVLRGLRGKSSAGIPGRHRAGRE
ncbi:MAG TPA: murein biosynthesis integral membrane protein MurJ [Mycobacteriales bacterium]|nr:murein biosynthesis integral membrane protein MurJ [Mycobacteriales bacterium]